MEIEGKEVGFKMRSFRSCVSEAMHSVREAVQMQNKSNVVLFSILAFVMAALNTWMFSLIPGIIYVGFDFRGIQFTLCLLAMVAMTLIVVSILFSQVNKRKEICNIARMLKLIPANIAFLLVYVLVAAVVCYFYLVMKNNYTDVKLIELFYIFIIVYPLYFVFSLPLVYVNTKYMVETSTLDRKTFFHSYGSGFRNWGFIFSTVFLALLCLCIADIFICLPLHALALIQNIADFGKAANGDDIKLPKYFGVLVFLVSAAAYFIRFYFMSFMTYTGYYIYQTIECRRIEKN